MINILLIASIFGFVLSTILFSKKTANTQSTFFLGSFYFLLSVYAFQAYIIDGGHLDQYQWFFLWPLIPYNAIFVPVYFYFQTVFEDRLVWKKRYLILFIPLLLGLIDVGYVYLQPSHLYSSILHNAITTPKTRLSADYWLFTLNQHLLIRHIWQFGVLLALLPQLLAFVKEGKEDKYKLILNKWLMFFWTILQFMAILAILYALEKMIEGTGIHSLVILGQNSGIITLFLYIVLFLVGVIPLYFSSILHGYPQPKKPALGNKIEEKGDNLKFGLDEQEVITKLEGLKKNKLYLEQSFNLTECAREMEMPSHHISYFLKKQYGISFAAYKNNLRMDHAKHLIENGFLENNTVGALADECGFASRTSFSKTFKSLIDVSPSEYAGTVE